MDKKIREKLTNMTFDILDLSGDDFMIDPSLIEVMEEAIFDAKGKLVVISSN